MNSVISWVFHVVSSPFLIDAQGFLNMSTLDSRYTITKFLLTLMNSDQNPEAEVPISCENSEAIVISNDDAKLVVAELGMWLCSEGFSEKCLGGAEALLEEKEASLEELEAAFGVFDENGDGFISADELRVVLQRLRFSHGEDCERMIGAYDEDGDGRINFKEFKNLMESTA